MLVSKQGQPDSTTPNFDLSSMEPIIQGKVRSLNRYLACVTHPMDNRHIYICGRDRRNALHGDIVSVCINPIGYWKVVGTLPSVDDETSSSENSDPSESEDVAAAEDDLDVESEEPLATTNDVAEPSDTNGKIEYEKLFRSFASLKSLEELAADPNNADWPKGLPPDIDLSDCSYALRALPDAKLLRTGQVLQIMNRNTASRRFLGRIVFRGSTKSGRVGTDVPNADGICVHIPNDRHLPFIKLDPSNLPESVKHSLDSEVPYQYLCTINGWDSTSGLPLGRITGQLGDVNQLEEATKALLLEYGIEDEEFTEEHLSGLPQSPEEFEIPRIEYLKRRDFRSCCIMSIDPVTAKDIDDALHIKQLNSDLYEVGVHIADVSYFVKPGTPLDREASRRTTSVYLVQKVIPMLPPILCDHLCSLRPHTDKLAFSIVMRIRGDGEVLKTWFGRSLIRSRIKLSYDQAATILNSSTHEELPDHIPQPEAPFNLSHVRESLLNLNKIARKLRDRRIENGALTLQKAKIEFDLPETKFDSETDEASTLCSSVRNLWPVGFSIQSSGPSHQLIEEWMLLANQLVAKRIFAAFCQRHINPDRMVQWYGALLRNHTAPRQHCLDDLANLLKSAGIDLPDGRSKTIAVTLREHNERLKQSGCTEKEREAIMSALSHLVYVRMNMATYFSLDELLRVRSELQSTLHGDHEQLFEHTWHYGLNVPLYTHFTSPIRRYADLLVHRQLGVILANSNQAVKGATKRPVSKVNLWRLSAQAAWCNSRRSQARRAQEASERLFLTACVRDCGPLTMNVTVSDFTDKMIKVLLSEIGVVLRIPLDRFFKHVDKWSLVPQNEPDVSDVHVGPKTRMNKAASHILVEWTPPSTIGDTQPNHIQRKEIRILTVLPCSIFSLPNRLALSAQFLPCTDPTDCADIVPSLTTNSGL